MIELLQQEAASGFPHLAGTTVSGEIPLTEDVLNDWLRRAPNAPPGLVLDVRPSNRLVLRYGLVQVAATLDDEVHMEAGGPVVRLTLASSVVAWTLRQVWRSAAVRMAGRHVAVDLSALDPDGRLRPYWPCLERIRFETTEGRVRVQFRLSVR